MNVWGANTFPSHNRLPYPYLLVVRPWFHPSQVFSMFTFPYMWDKRRLMATSLFWWFSAGCFSWRLHWGQVDQMLVHPGVAPSYCFLSFGCLSLRFQFIYSFCMYLSICMHCILLSSIYYWCAGFASCLGGDATIEVKGPVPKPECTRTLGIEWGHEDYRTWSD